MSGRRFSLAPIQVFRSESDSSTSDSDVVLEFKSIRNRRESDSDCLPLLTDESRTSLLSWRRARTSRNRRESDDISLHSPPPLHRPHRPEALDEAASLQRRRRSSLVELASDSDAPEPICAESSSDLTPRQAPSAPPHNVSQAMSMRLLSTRLSQLAIDMWVIVGRQTGFQIRGQGTPITAVSPPLIQINVDSQACRYL